MPSVWKQTRPGINSGIDPGLRPKYIAGLRPGTSSVWTKARTNAVKADDVRYHNAPVCLKADQYSQWKMYKLGMKQRSGSSSLSVLKLIYLNSLVKCHVSLRDLCVCWMHAQILENHWQCNQNEPGTNHWPRFLCIFRNVCVKEA